MHKALQRTVWERARSRCEYCQVSQLFYASVFQIDHVIAQKHGGETRSENLALSCVHCNIHKGPNIAGIDPQSGEMVRLFHPRLDFWAEHFRWDGALLMAHTPIGRATVATLVIAALQAPYRSSRARSRDPAIPLGPSSRSRTRAAPRSRAGSVYSFREIDGRPRRDGAAC